MLNSRFVPGNMITKLGKINIWLIYQILDKMTFAGQNK